MFSNNKKPNDLSNLYQLVILVFFYINFLPTIYKWKYVFLKNMQI